jgi:L-alanine-DL-glutamate epimerase-like enolase superfamily enzyme
MTLGGLMRCRDLAARARAAGLSVVVSHLFDGPVALNAYAELALSLESGDLASGLMPHPALDVYPPTPLPGFAAATLSAEARSGTGFQLPRGFAP